MCIYILRGTAVEQWLTVLHIGRSFVRSRLVWLEFFIDIKSFRSHYGPGIDPASNRNEHQEHFLGAKGGWCVRLTPLPSSCAVVMKSGNLNFLEPSGTLQVCNGTDLPFYIFTLYNMNYRQHYTNRKQKSMGEERGACRVLVGKPEGKRPLGRPKRRWVDTIRMDLQDVGCGYVDWIGLAQDRDRWRTLVSAVMNLRVP